MNIGKNFKFIGIHNQGLIAETFVNFINKPKQSGVLMSEFLICDDLMYAEYLQSTLLLDEKIGISSLLKIQSLKQFIDLVYSNTVEEFEESERFSQMSLKWRIYKFLLKLDAEGLDFLDAEFGDFKKYFLYLANSEKNRLALSEEIAELYANYQIYRGDWLLNWQENPKKDFGKYEFNININSNFEKQNLSKSASKNLDKTNIWQALLWNYLYKSIKSESSNSKSKTEIHLEFKQNIDERIQNFLSRNQIPGRIIVAGINSMPPQFVEVFLILSAYIEVNFLYFNPSQYYWLDGKTPQQFLKYKDFAEELLAVDYGNPLILNLCQQGLDFLKILEQNSIDISNFEFDMPKINEQTLLGKIQADAVEFRSNSDSKQGLGFLENIESIKNKINSGKDKSIKFNIAHTQMREVEILRDNILDFFKKDESGNLQPRDILVLVSDIKSYEPIIRRVFDIERTGLAFYINDLYEKDERKLATSFLSLLDAFSKSKFSSSELFDFLNFEPLAKKFDLDQSQLEFLRGTVNQSNIRWGLNKKTKENLQLPEQEANTWQFGLKRMILGSVSYSEYKEVIPLKSSYGKSSKSIGGLNEFVQRLIKYQVLFAKDRNYQQWSQLINDFLEDFYQLSNTEDFFALKFIKEKLQKWRDSCEFGNLKNTLLSFKDFLYTYTQLLEDAKARKHYFGNSIEFCEFVSGRTISYKKIFILGLEESKIPHSKSSYSSLMEVFFKNPRLGDKSRHYDEKFTFLQTILLAKENLSLSWVGKTSDENIDLPPSILVTFLQEQISKIFGDQILEKLVQEYPLQGFDSKYFLFEKDAIETDDFATFAKNYFSIYQNEQKYQKDLAKSRNKLSENFKFAPQKLIKIRNLKNFLKSPTSSFYTDYLQVRKFDYKKVRLQEEETFELDPLQAWQVRNDFVEKFDFFYNEFKNLKKPTGAYGDDFSQIDKNFTYACLDDFIQEKLDLHLQQLFREASVFETEIFKKSFESKKEIKLLKNLLSTYFEFRNQNFELVFPAREFQFEFKNYNLEFDLPDIFFDAENKSLIGLYKSDKELKPRSEEQNKVEYFLNLLVFSLILDEIINLKNLDFKIQKSKIVILNLGKSLELPTLEAISASQLFEKILNLYPKPLATLQKTAFKFLSIIFSKTKSLDVLDDENEDIPEKAFIEAQKIFESELEYTNFIGNRYKNFNQLLESGFVEDTKNLYKDLFLLIKKPNKAKSK